MPSFAVFFTAKRPENQFDENECRRDRYNVSTRNPNETVLCYENVLGFINCPRPPFNFPGAWLYGAGHLVPHLSDISQSDKQQRPCVHPRDRQRIRGAGLRCQRRKDTGRDIEPRVHPRRRRMALSVARGEMKLSALGMPVARRTAAITALGICLRKHRTAIGWDRRRYGGPDRHPPPALLPPAERPQAERPREPCRACHKRAAVLGAECKAAPRACSCRADAAWPQPADRASFGTVTAADTAAWSRSDQQAGSAAHRPADLRRQEAHSAEAGRQLQSNQAWGRMKTSLNIQPQRARAQGR